MKKINRGKEVLREEGPYSFLMKSGKFARDETIEKSKYKYYNIRRNLLGKDIVDINGVLVNIDYGVISPRLKKIIRTEEYERYEKDLIQSNLHSNYPVIDLGSGIGYTTCVIDQITYDSVSVIGIEANKALIPVIESTKNLNDCEYKVVFSAYDSSKEFVEFQVANDFWSSSQYDRENRNQNKKSVPALSISSIIKEFDLKCPVQVVADIEGSEHDLIVNEVKLLSEVVSTIIFEYHEFSEYSLERYNDILVENGFEYIDSQEDVFAYSNEKFN